MKTSGTVLAILLLLLACGDSSDRTVIQNKGSDTLVNVAQAWAEAYAEENPEVAVAVTGGGSGVGISALIDGNVDLANASRKMKQKEIDAAKENGVEPVEWVVAFDALAVYVHNDNPVESLTLAQLAEIYGKDGNITKWSQLGVDMPDDRDEIILVSRMNNSGTYVYFKETVLGKDGQYRLGSRDMHGSKDVVDLVENTVGAIGYSGLAYATDHVKMVPIVKAEGGTPVSPTVATASSGEYPIARPLLMYTAGQPEGAVKDYLDWILSAEGQKIIIDKGYAPAK